MERRHEITFTFTAVNMSPDCCDIELFKSWLFSQLEQIADCGGFDTTTTVEESHLGKVGGPWFVKAVTIK